MSQYRIVTDEYAGFEAQVKYWWCPFWMQVNGCNSMSTIEASERYCIAHANRGRVVKHLGHWVRRKDEPEVTAAKTRPKITLPQI